MRPRVPGSSLKTFAEQRTLLLQGEGVAPVTLVAVVLLCHLQQTGQNLLDDHWTRCAEVFPVEDRVALSVDGGRVRVSVNWDDYRDDRVWVSACRKLNIAP